MAREGELLWNVWDEGAQGGAPVERFRFFPREPLFLKRLLQIAKGEVQPQRHTLDPIRRCLSFLVQPFFSYADHPLRFKLQIPPGSWVDDLTSLEKNRLSGFQEHDRSFGYDVV